MTKILVASTPVYGHFAPMRSIARHLVRSGHNVTFLTGEQYRSQVEAIGADFVPLTGLADYNAERPAGEFVELAARRNAMPAGLPQLEFDMKHVFADVIPDQHASLVGILEDLGQDAVVVQDAWFFGSWPFHLGAPGPRPAAVVSIGVSPPTLTSVDTAPFGLGLPPDATPAGRERNRELNHQVKDVAFAPLQEHLTRVLEGVGTTEPAPFFFDGIVTLPDLYLHLGIEGFEYPRSDAPSTLRFVGALTEHGAAARPLPEWWAEATAAETVVVVTQGTVANKDLSELIEPTLAALDGLEALVIAVTGRPAELADLPANARCAEFVPFDLLLPYTDVLVSNAGNGGVQSALSYGVPLVLAGATEDKPEVAARAAWTGAAVDLATNRPDQAALRKAVEAVLSEPGYRAAARRLQAEHAAHDALSEITAAIRELSA
jgi:UDP:flavonoid glycosyltransferase YjiC (YdhE family)